MQTLDTLARNLVQPLKAYFVSLDTTPVYVGARVYASSVQTAPNNTTAALSFTNARWDTDGLWTISAATRLTCTRAGVYGISATVVFAGNTSGSRFVYLRLNGGTNIAVQSVPGITDGNGVNVTTVWQMAVGDYIEVPVWQNSGVGLTVQSISGLAPELAMHRLA